MKRLTASLAALALVLPALALAGDFETIFEDYRADGVIDACQYTDAQLRRAEDQVPPDIEQYAPGFIDALRDAREKLARGDCDKRKQGAATPPGAAPPVTPKPPAAPGQFTVPEPPAPNVKYRTFVEGVAAPSVKASGGTGAPALVKGLGIVAALAGLAGLIAALLYFFGLSPERWLRPFRTAATEAGMRSSDLAADFREWVRLGR